MDKMMRGFLVVWGLLAVSAVVIQTVTGHTAKATLAPVSVKPAAVQKAAPSANPAPAPAPKPAPVAKPAAAHTGGIHMSNLKCGDDYVEGDVTNNNDHAYDYVEVRVTLKDASKVRVRDTFTNTLDLKPGEKWHFKAPVFGDSYEYCDAVLSRR